LSGLSDTRHPLFWFDVRLIYTDHAKERAEQRGIEVLDYLPPKSKFIKKSIRKRSPVHLFSYKQDKRDVVIVICEDGIVLTVYYETPYNHYVNFGTIKSKKGFEYQININKHPHRYVEEQMYM
jgi:hypothetical protein